jgi:hypothetical protein
MNGFWHITLIDNETIFKLFEFYSTEIKKIVKGMVYLLIEYKKLYIALKLIQ